MLILNFNDERVIDEKRGRRSRKKVKSTECKRYSISINGKTVIVLELRKIDLQNENVLMLLKMYKGKVLVSEKYKNDETIKEYLYNPKEYYQRALLSSLINQVKSVNKDWKNICVRVENFLPFKEFYEIVRISKTVTILTEENAYTRKFSKDCFYDFGAIVSIKKDMSINYFDVFFDLDEIEDNGKLIINVNGKDFLLYPDNRYFENYPEYQKLMPYNIESNIVCAAFSNK